MPTFQEIMAKAVKADKAGDAEGARILVREARRIRSLSEPQAAPVDFSTPHDPRADLAMPKEDGWVDRLDNYLEPVPGDTYGNIVPAARSGKTGALRPALPLVAREIVSSVAGLVDAPRATLAGEIDPMDPATQGEIAQGVFNTVAGGGGGGVRVSKSAIPRALEKKAAMPPTPRQAAARAADDLGITPSLGMTGKTPAMAAAGLEKVPTSGKVIADDAVRAVAEIEGVFQKINKSIGTAKTSDRAGEALQGGINKFAERTKEVSNGLFDLVSKKIPEGTTIEAPNTVAEIRAALKAFEGNPAIAKRLGLDEWAGFADDLERGLSWEAARALRTQIGESIGKLTGPMTNMGGGRLKRAYATLSEDLGAAAKANGATKEWNAANKYYKARADRLTKQLDKMIKPDNPERAFEILANSAKGDRATSDLNRLRSVKSSLKKDEWNDLSASLLERLGRAKSSAQGAEGDVFSPAKFLREWNDLSASAKSLIVPKSAREELKKLTQVIESSSKANLERNFSNTGTAVGWLATIFGTSIDMGTTAAALGGSYLGAKAMTHPTFLRALNKAARGDMRQINAMASGKGPFAQEAKTIMRLSAAEAQAGNQAAANQGAAPLRAVSTP